MQAEISISLLELSDLTLTPKQETRIAAINAYWDDGSDYPPRFEYYQDLENPGEEDMQIVWKHDIHSPDDPGYDTEQEAATLDEALDQAEDAIKTHKLDTDDNE